jgi:inhibitor of cysteine peptidase
MKLIGISLLVLLYIFSGCKINSKAMKTAYEISIGESFQIELASNPTTGYSWKWANKQEVSAVDTIDNQYIPDSPDRIGGGGKEIWKFKGLKSGSEVIKLEYRRSWQSGPAAETKTISVKVK